MEDVEVEHHRRSPSLRRSLPGIDQKGRKLRVRAP